MSYRTTAEALKQEKYLYLTGSTPYSETDSFSLFVTRIENVITNQNSGWVETVKNMVVEKKDEQSKGTGGQQAPAQDTDD